MFGLITAATGQYDFLAGWLVAAYVLVAALIAVNAMPVVQRLPALGREALAAEAEGTSPNHLVDEMARIRGRVALIVAVNVTFFAIIILDMVLKPF